MTDLETILSWFQTGDMPTEEEFRQTFSSFRHKNTKIPIEEIDRLESLLNSKINADDYIKDGKIRADKIEPLGLAELVEASEKDISEFVENSDKYEFQQNDFIAIPNEDGNFSLYLFKGGEKRNKSNYLSTGVSNGGGFIPLTGTEPDKPLTNPIQYTQTGTNDIAVYSGSLESSELRSLNFGADNDVRIDNYSPSLGYHKVQVNPFNINMESWDNMYYNTGSIVIAPGNVGIRATVDRSSGIADINVSGTGVSITGLTNAQGDATFTRQLVQKDDGTIGYLTSSFESGQFDSFGQIDSFGQFPGDSISGICFYEYQKGSKYVTVRLKIYIYLGTEDENPHGVWINVPFGLGYTQQRIFDAFTDNSVIMTTQLNQISFMKTTREAMGISITACYTFPYGAEAGDS